MELKWYIVHTYSGFENKVKQNLAERIKSEGLAEMFGQMMVPTEQVIELRKGQKKTSSRKFFPGYILVEMGINEKSWHLVKNTPKVIGFVGGVNPPPVPDHEVKKLLLQMEEGVTKPKSKFHFEEGDEVRVVDGPFTNFQGVVEEIKPDKEKLKVRITIFGRPTPVELDFIQVNLV